jgi:ribonuclease P protein component
VSPDGAEDDLIEDLLADEEGDILPPEAGSELVPVVRYRFPKSARLTESSEFSRVKNAGRSFHGRYMIMGVYRDRPSTRFGLITSRRVGNAVVRNRLRRRLRDMVRLAQPGIIEGVWIVLVVRAAAGTVKTDALRSEFVALCNKAAIFVPKQ